MSEQKIWKLGEYMRDLQRRLSPRYGEGEAKAMVRLIFHALKGWSVTDLTINSDREVSDYIVGKVEDIVGRLQQGEPIQYILGEARFYGMDFKVSPAVLIPRHETEELVDLMVDSCKAPDLRVLDVGTGSGAIAIALSRNLAFPHITAIDISPEALEVARDNASRLHASVSFLRQDVFTYDPPADSFDIIVSNPPYIAESERKDMDDNVVNHEPARALFVPDDNPLVYYSRIAEIGRKSLSPGGKLFFEINPLFADNLRSMLESEGYVDVSLVEDISHKTRFAIAQKK